MAVVISNDFTAKEEEIYHYFHLFSSICLAVMGPDAMILVFFLVFSFKPALSLSSFTLIKRLFSSSSLSAIKVASSTYLRLLMFLLPILIPACNSSSLPFHMMCSAYRLSKQGDSRQLCHTHFSILNQSVVPYRVLTCFLTHIQVSQKTGKMVWYSHLFKSFPQFIMIHTVKGFAIVDKTGVDIFWNSLAFCMFQQMLAISSLVPLPFLNPAWIFGSSWLT